MNLSANFSRRAKKNSFPKALRPASFGEVVGSHTFKIFVLDGHPTVRKGFGEGEKAKGLLAGMLEGQVAFLA